jgi:uncharacterized membrane protein YfcA
MMRRAWRWYRRTVSEGWRRKTVRQRRQTSVILAVSIAFWLGTVVILQAPNVRAPVLIGVLLLFGGGDMLYAIKKARRKRR